LAIIGGGAVLHAGGFIDVTQLNRAFSVAALTLHVGDTVRFNNKDPFNHQIYVKSLDFNFDSPEQVPGETVNLTFTKPGTFDVQCGIHPRMHLSVTVQ